MGLGLHAASCLGVLIVWLHRPANSGVGADTGSIIVPG